MRAAREIVLSMVHGSSGWRLHRLSLSRHPQHASDAARPMRPVASAKGASSRVKSWVVKHWTILRWQPACCVLAFDFEDVVVDVRRS